MAMEFSAQEMFDVSSLSLETESLCQRNNALLITSVHTVFHNAISNTTCIAIHPKEGVVIAPTLSKVWKGVAFKMDVGSCLVSPPLRRTGGVEYFNVPFSNLV